MKHPELLSRKQFFGCILGIEGTEGRVPFTKTITDTLLFYSVLQSARFMKYGINRPFQPPPNSHIDLQYIGQRVKESVIDAPIQEEALFRAYPNILLMLNGEHAAPARLRGVAIAGVFALTHTMEYTDQGFVNYLKDFDDFSLEVFAGGIFLWRIARERGYLHSMLAHAVFNAATFIFDTPGVKNKEN